MTLVSSGIRLLSTCATFAALIFAVGGTCAAAPARSFPYDLSAFAAPHSIQTFEVEYVSLPKR